MAVNNLDLARVYSAGEQIKGLRSQNALAQMTMENKQQFSELAPKIAAGDEAATLAGAAIAPQDTTAIMSAVSKMGEAERARMKANYDEIGTAAAWADSPEKWTQAIDFLNKSTPAGDGFEQYRGQFANRQMIVNRIREVSDILGGKGDAFTLAPGGRRYDAEGNQIAASPMTPSQLGHGDNVSAITLEHPENGAITLSRRDPKLAEYLQPGSGWVETSRTKQGDLPAGRKDDINTEMGALNRGRERVAVIRRNILENRSRAGFGGTISRAVQEGLGIVENLTEMGVDVPGIVGETVQDAQNDLNRGLADEGIAEYFDPAIPQNDVLENSLAYSLARARKGSGRLNRDDVENARKDTKITGLRSVDSILSKLATIDKEFADAQADLEKRRGGASAETPTYYIKDGKLVKEE